MNLKKVIALVLFFFATALPVYAVDFICFEGKEDCKEKGPLLNIEWIMAVRHVGNGQIEIWFDGYPGLRGSLKRSGVDWDYFLSNVIQKQDFKQFANFYIKERYLRRIACTDFMCELQIHPDAIRLTLEASDPVRAYLNQQVEAGRVLVMPSK
ncbi:hypothetical protein [Candidatus Entotheonella palauensis]|uniref:KTSC domain-containing protein n=1 Tax=Candidatus Entotheonella gemina TaxID=1429439 RepID=W4M136_9BACT|nr:hypothetical protein [Candidatus Entotheonella palauensis]ETX03900.1 MAG: hypothetical protein ETSY2_31920 [Candidatus Entotheonella gemina]